MQPLQRMCQRHCVTVPPPRPQTFSLPNTIRIATATAGCCCCCWLLGLGLILLTTSCCDNYQNHDDPLYSTTTTTWLPPPVLLLLPLLLVVVGVRRAQTSTTTRRMDILSTVLLIVSDSNGILYGDNYGVNSVGGMPARPVRTEQLLYEHLTTRYQKDVRPTAAHWLPTNVTLGFLLNQVVDVNEKEQVLTTRSWLNINWMDKRLSWNRSLYDGIDTVYIPHEKVWKPDVLLTNNADPNIKDSIMSTDVSVQWDGNVTWLYAAIYRSPCLINVQYYPFDDQRCEMRFSCWSHTGGEIVLRPMSDKGDLSNYLNNSEFSLLGLDTEFENTLFPCCRVNRYWPTVRVIIELRRRPLFYVFNHILPCVMISMMGILGFSMPPDTGEKVTLCITTMLSMGVYLKTITEIIPPTSEAVPLIGVYYVVSLMLVCGATVMNVWTLNLYRRGYNADQGFASPWVKRWILKYMARMLCINVRRHHMTRVLEIYDGVGQRGQPSPRRELDMRRDTLAQQLVPLNMNGLKFSQPAAGGETDALMGSSQPRGSIMPLPNNVKPALFTQPWEMPVSTPQVLRNTDGSHQVDGTMAIILEELTSALSQISETLKAHEDRQNEQVTLPRWDSDQRELVILEWRMLACVIDRFLLILFLLLSTLTSVVFLVRPLLTAELQD